MCILCSIGANNLEIYMGSSIHPLWAPIRFHKAATTVSSWFALNASVWMFKTNPQGQQMFWESASGFTSPVFKGLENNDAGNCRTERSGEDSLTEASPAFLYSFSCSPYRCTLAQGEARGWWAESMTMAIRGTLSFTPASATWSIIPSPGSFCNGWLKRRWISGLTMKTMVYCLVTGTEQETPLFHKDAGWLGC